MYSKQTLSTHVVYKQPPPLYLPYLLGESSIGEVDRSLQRREAMINQLNCNSQELSLEWNNRQIYTIWLKLQPYRQTSVQSRANVKLSQKFFGPYQITVAIGKVAYKLELPSESKIHNVFHVSQLKAFHGTLPQAIHIPTWMQGTNTEHSLVPAPIIDRRVVKFHNKAQVQYLV